LLGNGGWGLISCPGFYVSGSLASQENICTYFFLCLLGGSSSVTLLVCVRVSQANLIRPTCLDPWGHYLHAHACVISAPLPRQRQTVGGVIQPRLLFCDSDNRLACVESAKGTYPSYPSAPFFPFRAASPSGPGFSLTPSSSSSSPCNSSSSSMTGSGCESRTDCRLFVRLGSSRFL
jgi:hypothetical protein